MPVLARIVSRGELWARAAEPTQWQGDDFPFDVFSEVSEGRTGGLSFWELQRPSDPMLKRIAAAYAITQQKAVQSAQVRFVDRAIAEGLGIKIETTPGNTADNEVNQLHRDLQQLTAKQAIELVRAMAFGAPVVFKADDVTGFIAKGVRRGTLSITTQSTGLGSLHRELVTDLFRRQALRFAPSVPRSSARHLAQKKEIGV